MSDSNKIKVVCLGYVMLTGKRKGVGYCALNEDGKETDDILCFKYNSSISNWAGEVYEVERTDGGVTGDFVYIGPLDDNKRRAAIQLESKSISTEFTIIAREKKSGGSKEDIFACLDPLRKAYHSTNHAGRTAIIAQVISHMQMKL